MIKDSLWTVHLWIVALRDRLNRNEIEEAKNCQRNLRKAFNKFRKEFEEMSSKQQSEVMRSD